MPPHDLHLYEMTRQGPRHAVLPCTALHERAWTMLRSLAAVVVLAFPAMGAQAALPSPQPKANAVCTALQSLKGEAGGAAEVRHAGSRLRFAWNGGADGRLNFRVMGEAPADAPRDGPVRLELAAAPRSSLVTDPAIGIVHASTSLPTQRIDLLAQSTGHSPPTVLAIGVREIDPQGRALAGKVTWTLIPPPPELPARDAVVLASLEHLYVQALSQDPASRFSLAVHPLNARMQALALSSVELPGFLQHIAVMRACIGQHADVKPVPVSWEVASLKSVRMPKKETDAAAVALVVAGKPMAGVRVFLDRAPHYACSGLTDAKGVMSCVLEDTHGHKHVHESHEGQEHAPIIASYPGSVTASSIKLPTAAPMWFPRGSRFGH